MTTESERPKRRFARCQVEQKAGVLYQGRYEIETVVEISEGGMLIESDRVYETGEIIETSFILGPKSQLVTARGEVIYTCNGPLSTKKYGVRFSAVRSESIQVIRRYVSNAQGERQPS